MDDFSGQGNRFSVPVSSHRGEPYGGEEYQLDRFIDSVRDGNIREVESLLTNPNLHRSVVNQAFQIAVLNNDADMVQLLLRDPRVDPSAKRNRAIIKASHFGHYDVVEELLKDPRVNPGTAYNLPLRVAVRYNQPAVVRLLLGARNVDPTVNDNEPIRTAYRNNFVEIFDILSNDPRVDPSAINRPINRYDILVDRMIQFNMR